MIKHICFCLLIASITAEKPTSSPDAGPTASASSKEATPNTLSAPIPTKSPPQQFYPSVPVPQAPQQPLIQYIGKPLFTTNHPRTMLIIAQPALVPQHYLNNQAQMLLHYFQNNPQAKYQLLYGNRNRLQTAQAVAPVAPVQPVQSVHPVQTVSNYRLLPPVQATYPPYVVGNSLHYNYQQQPPQQQPQQQQQYQVVYQYQPVAAQTQSAGHYSSQGPQTFASQEQPESAPPSVKTAPPIITGLENFTPEQQAQIKEQLSQYFGGSLRQIDSNSLQAHPGKDYIRKYRFQVQQDPLTNNADNSGQSSNYFVPSASNYYRPPYTKYH